MTHWPPYIDPNSGDKLYREININKKFELTSKIGVTYPIVKGIPRILKILIIIV